MTIEAEQVRTMIDQACEPLDALVTDDLSVIAAVGEWDPMQSVLAMNAALLAARNAGIIATTIADVLARGMADALGTE